MHCRLATARWTLRPIQAHWLYLVSHCSLPVIRFTVIYGLALAGHLDQNPRLHNHEVNTTRHVQAHDSEDKIFFAQDLVKE